MVVFMVLDSINLCIFRLVFVVFVKIQFNFLARVDSSVTPSVGNVMCRQESPFGVYKPITAVHNSIRSFVLVVELTIPTNLVPVDVGHCKIHLLLVKIFYNI